MRGASCNEESESVSLDQPPAPKLIELPSGKGFYHREHRGHREGRSFFPAFSSVLSVSSVVKSLAAHHFQMTANE
jgi:hypothetical protein